jgi:hypothetical protein
VSVWPATVVVAGTAKPFVAEVAPAGLTVTVAVFPAVNALALASVPFAGVLESTPTPSGSEDDPLMVARDAFAVAGTNAEFAEPVGSNALPVLSNGLTAPFASDASVLVAGVVGVDTVVPPAVTVTVPFPKGVFAAVVPDPPALAEPVPPLPELDPEEPDEPESPEPPPDGVAEVPPPPLPAPTLKPPPSLLQAERRSAQLATPIANAEGRSFRTCVSHRSKPLRGRQPAKSFSVPATLLVLHRGRPSKSKNGPVTQRSSCGDSKRIRLNAIGSFPYRKICGTSVPRGYQPHRV